MKVFVIGLALLSLGGCVGGIQAEPPSTTIKALAQAGCKTSIDVTVGGSVGQLGGAATNNLHFSGSCDPSTVTPAPAIK